MKKLTAILSILLAIGLVHQGMVFAEAAKVKKLAKTNFTAKKKHAAVAAATVTTPAPSPTPSSAPATSPTT